MRTIPFFLFVLFLTIPAMAQNVPPDAARQTMLENALKQRPIQPDVEIDVPTAAEIKSCEIQIVDDNRCMIVLGPQKNTLRMFRDTDGDANRQVDQWSYYQGGVEVYRENDTDGNSKRDQFRWLNTAGTRWGVDANEDGVIDYWKEISAEEVSREMVLAVAENDVNRFLRIALSEEELKDLSLGVELDGVVSQKVAALKSGFAEAVEAAGFKDKNVQWYQLNAVMPGLVPKGDRGNGKDLVVYENTMATVEVGNETRQIALGTLVKIGDNNWRALDLPRSYDDTQLSFTFIQPSTLPGSTGPTNTEVIGLMAKISEIQNSMASLPAEERPAKHKEVVALMIKIIAQATTNEERDNWIEQMAYAIMLAVMSNEFPQGSEQIKVLFDTVEKSGNDELIANVRSRQIATDYYAAMNSGADGVKAYSAMLAALEDMVARYEKTEAGVEAMLQLASSGEVTSQSVEAPLKWYTKVAQLAGGKPIAEKAKGAIRRLTSPGKAVPFQTTDISGKTFDIASLKDRIVVLCFWNDSSTQYMKGFKDVVDNYEDVAAVGVNIDNDAATMKASVERAGTNWPQLFTPGGYDSSNAVYWGIVSAPYLIVYGKDGNVAKVNIHSAEELDQALSQLTK